MNKEILCFLRYNLIQGNIFNTLKFYSIKFLKKIKKISRIKNYPLRYKYLLKEDLINIKDDNKVTQIIHDTFVNVDIKLASRSFNIKTVSDIHKKFNDPEDFESLHRFIWLRTLDIDKLNMNKINQIEKIIIYWCQVNNQLNCNSSLIWHPYTISERIINILYYYSKIKKNIPLNVRNNIHGSTNLLIKNLEFYEIGYGNHLLNNIRSILTYSLYFDNKQLQNIFTIMFEEYLDNFLIDGFSKDYSSHYQLLLCYWLFDLKQFLKIYENNSILEIIDNYYDLIKSRALFFYNEKNNYFTFFGDISPDYSAEFLLENITSQ
ncbi:MAG: hypothetical protein CMD65_03590 [Gammaproteobacteria bacterium]|nr:hypothetical protein [Gammaproteobacteria bacterium]|tara:strand:- start:1743 stop:2702 length:960 start_codon:yes stop_codon:yes gene_type:complete